MPLERPHAPDLLETARVALMEELLPALPEPQRLVARMVANAMGIAAREAALDGSVLAGLRARAAALAGDATDPLRAFARAIRAGAFDPGMPLHGEAAALLRDLARLRCAVSAPKALGGA